MMYALSFVIIIDVVKQWTGLENTPKSVADCISLSLAIEFSLLQPYLDMGEK